MPVPLEESEAPTPLVEKEVGLAPLEEGGQGGHGAGVAVEASPAPLEEVVRWRRPHR